MKAGLSIIIVNWNGLSFLPDCLDSIVENPPSVPYEIVVVDNASTDGSLEWLRSREADSRLKGVCFSLIESSVNLGFGRANNLAIEQQDSPFIFLLNPDTVVKPNAIDVLVGELHGDEGIGAVAPKLLNKDGSLQPSVFDFPPTFLKVLAQGLKLHKLVPKIFKGRWLYGEHWTYDIKESVPSVSGAAILTRREVLEKVGGFDPAFHMYGEDSEWCMRVRSHGWKILFIPMAEVFHIGGQSSHQRWDSLEKGIVQEEAFILFLSRTLSPLRRLSVGFAKILVLSFHHVRWTLQGKDASTLAKQIRLQLRNCRVILNKQKL